MSARILVVDDHPLNLKLLAAKLAHDYYIVSTAENGLEAIEKIDKEKPDIILLDVMMPVMNGFDACKKIKSDPATSHIPVIIVTALSDIADRVRGLEAGADDFLTKPINDVALMARVRSLLRLKMIMDEWRLREATSNQFGNPTPGENAALAAFAGGQILLLTDDSNDRQTITKTLGTMSVRVEFATTVAEAATMVASGTYDMTIASIDLLNEDGLQICPQLRTNEVSRQLPILLLANETEIGRVAKGLDLGANDYLMRPLDANELLARTRTQLKHKRHYERLRKNYENSLALSLVDPLTGAFNRRYLEAHLPKMMARSITSLKPMAAMMIDIDHFKQVNDTYGHSAGDIVLKDVVSAIMNGLRPSDLVVRMGGEEFAVIMPETDLNASLIIGDRLRERVAGLKIKTAGSPNPLNVTVSIGVAHLDQNQTDTVDMVLKRADAALYKAKESGRNRVVTDREGGK